MPSVESQSLLHHPSTSLLSHRFCVKSPNCLGLLQHNPVPCTPFYNVLLPGNSKPTLQHSIKALTPIPEPLMGHKHKSLGLTQDIYGPLVCPLLVNR